MRIIIIFIFSVFVLYAKSQQKGTEDINWNFDKSVLPGINSLPSYLPLLENKKVAVLANQTSLLNATHLIDTLIAKGINVVKVFAPEHGFRGDIENGGMVNDSVDQKTGLKIISLYGKHHKPTPDDLTNVDVLVFDIQDVGVRFYTYISTLQYVMEACSENKVKLILLDRPNPNGFYVDGPVLDPKFKSFVGMQPVPVVYGMTIGEYAMMLNGEGWLNKGMLCNLKVIPCINYDHAKFFELPVAPSPNLPNMHAVYLYPSLCLFEGTPVSVGRGTEFPFQVAGFPGDMQTGFSFTPVSTKASLHPPFENQKCNGMDFRPLTKQIRDTKQLMIKFLVNYYRIYPDKEKFFTPFFDKLTGNDILKQQIKAQISEQDIRLTWKNDLDKFKEIRKKYLIYKDFE